MTALQEQLFGNWRDGNVRGRMHHASGILAGAEDGETVLRGTEGFNALVGLLAIVQAGGHSVDREVRGADEGWRCPLGVLDAVVGFDVAIDFPTRSIDTA